LQPLAKEAAMREKPMRIAVEGILSQSNFQSPAMDPSRINFAALPRIRRPIKIFRSALLICLTVASILLLPETGTGATSASTGVVDPEVEKALLQGEWETVVSRCGPDDENLAEAPLLRAIKGHACLALNRNNQSLILLLSIGNERDKQAWKAYTQSLSQRAGENAVALYLKGDALARAGDLDGAIGSYSQALAVNPHFQLALIGRGTAFAAKKQWKEAREDFEEAQRLKDQPALAEAYASMGVLQILKRAPEGARESYKQAINISPDYVLALNGLACANYGLAEWEVANKNFAEAIRVLPLPLFLGNLRALGVAAENLHHKGQENSPLFRFTDFYDWETLREETLKPDDVFRFFLGRELPLELDEIIIADMNKALENLRFCDATKGKIIMEGASQDLAGLIVETAMLRKDKAAKPNKEQIEKIRLLNRMLLEQAYPFLIARHTQRDPGMQLTLTHGLINQMDYKRSLSPAQIAQGQWNMDYIGRPFANALDKSGIPIISFLGKQLNDHINFSTKTNELALQKNYGIGIADVRPGGVTTDMRSAFVDSGKWPVVTWFGLVQSTPRTNR
jgi:tetratricopeptide (TPR) repeat protein